ncbi:fimbrial protein, partial [Burkholderia pseudomallei]
PAPLDATALALRIGGLHRVLVVVDVSGGLAPAASAGAAAVRGSHPGLPIVALGSLGEPGSAVAALRAGVGVFIVFWARAEE